MGARLRGFFDTVTERQCPQLSRVGTPKVITSTKTAAAEVSAQSVRIIAERPIRCHGFSRANKSSQVASEMSTMTAEILRAKTIVGVHNASSGTAVKAGASARSASKSTRAVTMATPASAKITIPAPAGTGGGWVWKSEERRVGKEGKRGAR